MALAPPLEVLFHDAAHPLRIAGLELEGHREHHVAPVMEDRVVIAELEVADAGRPALAFLGEDLGGLGDLRDEHGPLPGRRGREEVEVLPERSADG